NLTFVGRLNALIPPDANACSVVLLKANRRILSSSGSPGLLKLTSLTSCPTSGAGSVAFAAENPKSPSRLYSAAPRRTGPFTNEFATKSIPWNEESPASIASGDVICCGGNFRTSLIGTSSFRIVARLAFVHMLGGFVGSGTQRSSPGPPTGLNTAWLEGRKPNRSGQPW